MEQIPLDHFLKYSFLSDLKLSHDQKVLYFTETKAELKDNDYVQRLYQIDTLTKEVSFLTEYEKNISSFFVNDELYLIKKDEDDLTVHTRFVKLDGSDEFKLPCAVSSYQNFNEQFDLALISINRKYSNNHHLSSSEREADAKKRKEDKDYVVFDEYPFFFNGAGITNGSRNMLVLVDRKTHELIDLTSQTMDVESFDVINGDILYSGVDFETFKGKNSCVYKVNVKTLETEVLYDKPMQISRVFELHGKIIVLGTFGKEYGAMEANKFYELNEGAMTLICDHEYSMYNSVGSDCRYGKTKNFLKVKNKAYFITTDKERSVVLEFDGSQLKTVCDLEGSCDDLAASDDALYVIGMKHQALQEVYEIVNGKNQVLTHMNQHVFEGMYVAKPFPVAVAKAMEVNGWVLLPKDYDPQKRYPAILNIHGGPKTAYGEVFVHEMQHWASLGYFVMFCNPRGSDGKGNAFADLRKSWGTIDYEDIMDFVDEVLKQYPAIDQHRLGVTGGSYGGYMTNWIIGHTDRFKAAASQRSISNWITEVCASDYGIDFPIEQEYDDLYNCHDELWDMSPLKYANQATTPTLFIHSTEDYRCPISEAIQMYTVLKCRGVESRLVAFVNENHDLSRTGKPLHRIRRLTEITEWMRNHLE